jgi:hypothetical protein
MILNQCDKRETNCIIIHGCPSNVEKAIKPETRTYDKHWIPWIKEKLLEGGVEVETPLMPKPLEHNSKKFSEEFEKSKVTENTILMGHSCWVCFLG